MSSEVVTQDYSWTRKVTLQQASWTSALATSASSTDKGDQELFKESPRGRLKGTLATSLNKNTKGKIHYPLILVLAELMCYEKTFVKVKWQKSSEKESYGLFSCRDIFSIKNILKTLTLFREQIWKLRRAMNYAAQPHKVSRTLKVKKPPPMELLLNRSNISYLRERSATFSFNFLL